MLAFSHRKKYIIYNLSLLGGNFPLLWRYLYQTFPSSCAYSLSVPQRRHHPFPDSLVAPDLEVMIDRGPSGIVMRQQRPRVATAQEEVWERAPKKANWREEWHKRTWHLKERGWKQNVCCPDLDHLYEEVIHTKERLRHKRTIIAVGFGNVAT
jgi:hypothetical protein